MKRNTDAAKRSDVINYFQQHFPSYRIETPYGPEMVKNSGEAPYYFLISRDSSTLAIVFIQRMLWDNSSLLTTFNELELIKYIQKNQGCQIIVTNDGIKPRR